MMGDRLGQLLVKEGRRSEEGRAAGRIGEPRRCASLRVGGRPIEREEGRGGGTRHGRPPTEDRIAEGRSRLGAEGSGATQRAVEGAGDRPGARAAGAVGPAGRVGIGVGPGDDCAQLLRANELGLEAAKLELQAGGSPVRANPSHRPVQRNDPEDLRPAGRDDRPTSRSCRWPTWSGWSSWRKSTRTRSSTSASGQQALVTSKAFQPPYDQKGLQGKVTRIGRMINTPVLKSVDPFAPADRHVVEVRVRARRRRQPADGRAEQFAGRRAVSEEGVGQG